MKNYSRFEMTDETRRLMANVDFLVGHLETYVDNNYDLKEEEIDEINDSIAVMRSMIFDYQECSRRYDLCNEEKLKITGGFLESIKRIDRVLIEACYLLAEGYGNEYSDWYLYLEPEGKKIKIPTEMNGQEWKKWLMEVIKMEYTRMGKQRS